MKNAINAIKKSLLRFFLHLYDEEYFSLVMKSCRFLRFQSFLSHSHNQDQSYKHTTLGSRCYVVGSGDEDEFYFKFCTVRIVLILS